MVSISTGLVICVASTFGSALGILIVAMVNTVIQRRRDDKDLEILLKQIEGLSVKSSEVDKRSAKSSLH
jgi:hypothetical protein